MLAAYCDMKENKEKQIANPHVNGYMQSAFC